MIRSAGGIFGVFISTQSQLVYSPRYSRGGRRGHRLPSPSAAEYCAPVWSRSAHTSQVDVQLNSTMHLISDTLCCAPLPWLPVLSNIEPPALRRKAATDKLVEKIIKHDSWPIQLNILNPPLLRLMSRKLLWLDLQPVVQLTSKVDGGITGSRLRWSILI